MRYFLAYPASDPPYFARILPLRIRLVKIVHVVEEKLAVLLRGERLLVCRHSSPMAPLDASRKRLQTLRSFNSLLAPLEVVGTKTFPEI